MSASKNRRTLLPCLIAAFVVSAGAQAQEQPAERPSPCSSPEYRQLDFWLGEWEVTDAAGTTVGKSRVERILNGCAVQENWEGANGWPGKSFNVYNRTLRQWQQFWVSGWGSVTLFLGRAEEDRMVYVGETTDREGRPAQRRMTIARLGPDRVRQVTEMSYDEGRSWQPDYDFTYTRAGDQRSRRLQERASRAIPLRPASASRGMRAPTARRGGLLAWSGESPQLGTDARFP